MTEQDFGELVDKLRRKSSEANRQNTPNTNTAHAMQDRPVTKQVSPKNDNDGNSRPQASDVFAEFVNGWRNLMSNKDASRGRPQRKLDVLSWGFGG